MGANSSLLAKRVIDNTYQVLAIEMLSLVQAVDYLKIVNKLSSPTKKIFMEIRNIVPRFEEDTIKHIEIKKIIDYLCTKFIIVLD
jgi:histidine ammonia-lyase